MTTITIPPEAIEAAARAIFDAAPFREQAGELTEQSERYQALTRAYARAAAQALLAAWPGAYTADPALFGHKIILPLSPSCDTKGDNVA